MTQLINPFPFAIAQHRHPTEDWFEECEKFVRSAYGQAQHFETARDNWEGALKPHLVDADTLWSIPRGVPVFWLPNHVAISRGVIDGVPMIWTTDLLRKGMVDTAPTALVAEKWRLTIAGWTEDIEDVPVWTPQAA